MICNDFLDDGLIQIIQSSTESSFINAMTVSRFYAITVLFNSRITSAKVGGGYVFTYW